jgi:hypothetical protein
MCSHRVQLCALLALAHIYAVLASRSSALVPQHLLFVLVPPVSCRSPASLRSLCATQTTALGFVLPTVCPPEPSAIIGACGPQC